MKILFSLGHPAQFHLFKNVINNLNKKGHKIKVLVSNKDILEELCCKSDFEFLSILPVRKNNSKYSQFKTLINRYLVVIRFIFNYKPNLLVGSEVTFPIAGKTFGIPSILFSEDDAAFISKFVAIAYPFATTILSPLTCNAGKYEYKKVGYNGFQKLAYLHPLHFKPDKKRVKDLIGERYFILRFSKLDAYHDVGRNKGINSQIAQKLITILSEHGKVFITSERELEPQFEKYRINIDIVDIHHALYYADLYIGDSQSMAVEAAMLGTPGIRFNDFVGKIGVLEELEHTYKLTTGINPANPRKLFEKLDQILKQGLKNHGFKSRHKQMIRDKIDVLSFMIWFIENYPLSNLIMKEDTEYYRNFNW